MTTVLLVDDHDLIRAGLKGAFERDCSFSVIGETSSAKDAVHLVGALHPDVVVIDVNLPDGSGIDTTRQLRQQHDYLGIVVLTMYDDDDHLFQALDAGASAFVAKSAPTEAVLSSARQAAIAPHSFTAANLPAAMRRRTSAAPSQLTVRERDILSLMADGLTVPAAAKRLFISESTAKSHLANTYEKLGVNNRTQAVMAAMRLHLIKPQEPS